MAEITSITSTNRYTFFSTWMSFGRTTAPPTAEYNNRHKKEDLIRISCIRIMDSLCSFFNSWCLMCEGDWRRCGKGRATSESLCVDKTNSSPEAPVMDLHGSVFESEQSQLYTCFQLTHFFIQNLILLKK